MMKQSNLYLYVRNSGESRMIYLLLSLSVRDISSDVTKIEKQNKVMKLKYILYLLGYIMNSNHIIMSYSIC